MKSRYSLLKKGTSLSHSTKRSAIEESARYAGLLSFLILFTLSISASAEEASNERGDSKISIASLDEGFDFEQRRAPRGDKVALNFTQMELTELVHAIAKMTGRRFIIGPKVKSVKASIFSPTPVSSGEAYQAFLSVLASSGMTVEQAGRYLKIVQTDTARPRVCLEGESCPVGDQFITRLHRVDHVDAADLTTLLDRFTSQDGAITTYAPTNTMIVTDYATNVRRMLRIAEELDIDDVEMSLWIHPIHHASVTKIADVIRELFQAESAAPATTSAKSRPVAPGTKRGTTGADKRAAKAASTTVGAGTNADRLHLVIADERTNQLIIAASERTYLRIVALLRGLDIPLGESEGEVRVHKLQNVDAEEMATALSSLTKSSTKSSSRSSKRRSASEKTAPPAASLFEGEVQVTAHKGTNSLIITGSARDYLALKAVIDELDIERRQVFIEAVIMEVSVTGLRDLGISFHGGKATDVASDGTTDQALLAGSTAYMNDGNVFSSVLGPSLMQGLALDVTGPELEFAGYTIPSFGVVLQALQTSSDVNVLSQPHILAVDNEPAEIKVGQNVPVSTSLGSGSGSLTSLLSAASDSSTTSSLASSLFPSYTVGRQDVGIRLGFTPHVNQFDQIRLELELEVSEITDESNDVAPIIGQRIIKTTSIMEDEQTVVIGGLVTDRMVAGVQKTPILGDIPILGKLFQRSRRRSEKRNLVVFLTPHIIRDSSDFRRIFAKKMEERREFIDRYTAFDYHEVQPDIDYERTNGMLEEMRQVVAEVEAAEEMRRLAAAAVEEPLVHEPRPRITAIEPEDEPPEPEEEANDSVEEGDEPAEEPAEEPQEEPVTVVSSELSS